MHRGISLTDLARKIEGNKALKADYVADARSLSMMVQDDGKVALHAASVGSLPILPLAHDQIASKLAIPSKYYDRMLAGAPDLLADNVNRWIGQDRDRRMLRTIGGDLRAFLSDRYHRVENEEIAEVVLPVLSQVPGIQIISCEVTDRRMHIVATTPALQREVKVGDVVQAGVAISNSEVGLGAVSITPLIYRLVCLNGMKVNDAAMRRSHVGRRLDENENLNALFSDETRRADDRALLLKVRDVVRGAIDDAVFGRTVERLTGLTERRITGDPAKSVEMLAKKVGANEDERGGILRSLIEGGDLSAWGLLNAVTHQAHGAASYDRSMEFVEAGGAVLDLPASEWRTILEAA